MNSGDLLEIGTDQKNPEKVEDILEKFIKKFGDSYNLSVLTTTGQWVLLWNRCFDILKWQSKGVKKTCLQAIRILSRDKTYLNETIKDEQFECLLELANIGAKSQDSSDNIITAEALKVLCNLVFQSPKCQELCSKNTAVEGILRRLRTYRDNDVDYDIKFFDMNLLFLITALTPNIRTKVKDDCDGLIYLVEFLDMLMKSDTEKFTNSDVRLVNEILKILFNITVTSSLSLESEDDEHHFKRLALILHDLLLYEVENADVQEDYHSNIINLLTNIPESCYMDLIPPIEVDSSANFERRNMKIIDLFLDFLEVKLNNVFGSKSTRDYEQIPPVVTVLIKSVRCSSVIRRYVKKRILPPIAKADVMKKPEEGVTLRNRLCKLLTYPSTQISDLVAELLFILCKENVGKMIKYTGYGNAAGLFANRGLLGRTVSENHANYSSDSEDSDTEEYKDVLPSINPVVGRIEQPRAHPFEGMSDEQKEYEAEKLVQLIDQLDRKGLIKPCKIDEVTGKPVHVEHVLELQKEIPGQQISDRERDT